MHVGLRLFAAARAAAGAGSVALDLPEDATVADALAAVSAHAPEFAAVASRCSFLIDGVTATGGSALRAGATVDVLPPFAGG